MPKDRPRNDVPRAHVRGFIKVSVAMMMKPPLVERPLERAEGKPLLQTCFGPSARAVLLAPSSPSRSAIPASRSSGRRTDATVPESFPMASTSDKKEWSCQRRAGPPHAERRGPRRESRHASFKIAAGRWRTHCLVSLPAMPTSAPDAMPPPSSTPAHVTHAAAALYVCARQGCRCPSRKAEHSPSPLCLAKCIPWPKPVAG